MRPQSLPVPLLISSIGNPTTIYADTLHSAGHTILDAVQGIIRYPAFTPFLSGQKSALTHLSRRRLVFPFVREVEKSENEDDWTLWKSGSLMNVSGPAVAKAFERWRMEWEPRQRRGHLVVVHDELESGFGAVKMRDGWSSARGHNGVKSIQTALRKSKAPFTRICVGIGRPESRDPKDVSSYVLRKMTSKEKNMLGKSAHDCMKIIRNITDGVI